MKSTITHDELVYEISSLAYVIADVSEGKVSPHALHQTFDICEGGNLDRVDSLLTLAASEVAAALPPGNSLLRRRGNFILSLKTLRPESARNATELAREYMVASVLHGWLSVTLPSAAACWEERKEELLGSLLALSATSLSAFTRKPSPL